MSTLPLNAPVATWLERAHALEGDSADEREAARRISDRLYTEFGIPPNDSVQRTSHVITTARGALRIDEYRHRDHRGHAIPAFLSLHGGAFRLGDIDELVNVALCAQRAADAGVAVFSLSYRLAPEHPHPAASDDALEALSWLSSHSDALAIDPGAVIVGGVSAGGGLSLALCMRARTRGIPVLGQVLEVPVVDLRDDAVWLDRYAALNGFSTIADLRGSYCSPAEARRPEVSPLLGDLSGLPQTHVMLAEYDPLRGAAEQLVERLRAVGNETTASIHLGELHSSHALLREWRGARLWHAELVAVVREFIDRAH